MPIYIFTCFHCGHKMEKLYSWEELIEKEPHLRCEKCGDCVGRQIAPFVTHFNYTRKNKKQKEE